MDEQIEEGYIRLNLTVGYAKRILDKIGAMDYDDDLALLCDMLDCELEHEE